MQQALQARTSGKRRVAARRTLLHALAAAVLVLPAGAHAGQLPSAIEPAAASLHLASPSPRTVRAVLDSLGTRISLQLGYRSVHGDDWAMAGSPAIKDRRAFERRDDDRTIRRLEIGQSAHPAGGYELHFHGTVIGPSGSSRNADLAAVHQHAEALLAAIPQGDQRVLPSEYGVEVRTLGYMQADSVLGLLKALGYDTIEFHATAGDNTYENIYEPIKTGALRLPAIVKLIEGTKTSIMDPSPQMLAPKTDKKPIEPTDPGVPDMGGSYLHDVTTGEPLQRLLIVHDKDDPESLRHLLDLLENEVDVPARQVVIEALVLEINTDKISDLGLTFSWIDNSLGAGWGRNALGQQTEFTLDYDRFRTNAADLFAVKLHALVGSGEAKILSNPSVLVLDGRQARIQVGQRVPVITSTATANVVQQHVEYETVGIVLNLRPRLNARGSEVTMQVETIVSAVDPTGTTTVEDVSAPTFDNRLVQTYCRIADNTPFIVGGLISEDRREQIRKVPGLGSIPFLGGLFRRRSHVSANKEVIIVLTPHVVPKDEKGSSLVIAKDSPDFDSFDRTLFRNRYRIRRQDVFDLRFVEDSVPLAATRARALRAVEADPHLRSVAAVASLLDGAIPGEEILVRRMLWETIRRTGFAQHVNVDRIITFRRSEPGAASLQIARIVDLRAALPEDANTLVLTYDPTGDEEAPAVRAADVEHSSIPVAQYDQELMIANPVATDGAPQRSSILISRDHPGGADLMDFLRSIMVLKEVLHLNETLPQRIVEFYNGREIIYPTAQELASNYHVVDAEAARLFFEVQQYYPAFQCTFNQGMREITRAIDPAAALGPMPACVPQAPGPLVKVERPAATRSGRKSVARIKKPDSRAP